MAEKNFITFDLINPQEFSRSELRVEAARILNVAVERIEEVKCWLYQLWVKIKGVGGKFISYRRLSTWKEKVLSIIKNCPTQVKLGQLADAIGTEISQFARYYDYETVQEFRLVWKQRLDMLEAIAGEEREGRSTEEEVALSWKNGWLAIIPYCESLKFLQLFGEEIKTQSQNFRDFPDILTDLRIVWQQQKQKLDRIVSSCGASR